MKFTQAFLLILFFIGSCCIESSQSRIYNLYPHELEVLDGYIQVEILKTIKPKVENAADRYRSSVENCVRMINDTIDACVRCGKSANCNKKQLPDPQQLLNNISKKLLKDSSILIGKVGGSIARATQSAWSDTLKGLKKLSKSTQTVVKVINKGLNAASNVGKTVHKAVKGFFKSFGFGKRLAQTRYTRAVSKCVLKRCSECRRINTDSKTKQQIYNDVCRAILPVQNSIKNEILKLQSQANFMKDKKEWIANTVLFNYVKSRAKAGNFNFDVVEVKATLEGKRINLKPRSGTLRINIKDLAGAAKTLAPLLYSRW